MRKGNTKGTLKGILAAALVAAAAAGAHAQTASTSYHGAPRDPFAKFKPALKRKVEKKAVTPVTPPPIQARIDQYKALKARAMSLQQPAPKPTTALTLAEIQVIGITRTPRGYAAMVEATPIQLSYVIYPGEQFYDGMLVAIEETRLVFRRQTKWTDGHTDVAVETKALRQPNAVDDSLGAQRPTQAASAGDRKNNDQLNALVEILKAIAAGSQQQGGAGSAAPQQAGQPPAEAGEPALPARGKQ
ncbi:MAG TPA: hypothetical protein VNZ44_19530 [Pyrinomonadaceae bacterium]|nr:hypothetical protein [Pyrinomonadaceae bacterium]